MKQVGGMQTYQFDFEHPGKVHFIGIGGISMSGLAEILLKDGFAVSGSDMHESEFTEHLQSLGAGIFIGQRAENISWGPDCAVYTAAIHPDNPEFRACQEAGIPLLSRAELLGQLMRRYRHAVAVSGTHGKTTTTGMLSHIFLEAKLDPTISIGGVLPLIGSNLRLGGRDTFLLEACEYTNSFLSFFPTLEIILNIEADHLDFFKDLDDIRHSFRRFAERLPENGILVISDLIRDYREIVGDFAGQVITVGSEQADFYAEDVRYDDTGRPSFIPVERGQAGERISLSVPGVHNVGNAMAAYAAARSIGVPADEIVRALGHFGGAERRFEDKGDLHGVRIVDDYAHHPQEIEATLRAASLCPHNRIWCVFQPHTYSRTKALLPEFAEALSLADRVVLAEIYPARETDTLGVSSGDIARLINAREPGKAEAFPDFASIETFLLEQLEPGDLCITMGAGDIYKVGEELLGRN